MFKTIVYFTAPLSTLNETVIKEFCDLTIKYDYHSDILSTNLPRLSNSNDTLERVWQNELLVDEYVAELSNYSNYLTVTKIVI